MLQCWLINHQTKVRSDLLSYFVHTYDTQCYWVNFFVQKVKKNEEKKFNERFGESSFFSLKSTNNIDFHTMSIVLK